MKMLSRVAIATMFATIFTGGLTADRPPRSGFVFNLVPRSLQKRPLLNLNVITEMTEEGRKRGRPTPAAPQYYTATAGAFLKLGHGPSTGESPPPAEQLQKLLQSALATNGYSVADAAHPATIVVTFSVGSHSSPDTEGNDADETTVANEVLINDLYERARLVGGDKFAQEFIKAVATQGAAMKSVPKPRVDSTGGVDPQPNILGDAPTMMTQIFSPIERFRNRDPKTSDLMEDVGGSIYFVIASAYDYESAKTPHKLLLWRTKMTVNASGVALSETVPALIVAAGPYLGKDMTETETIRRHVDRAGHVELGDAVVRDYFEDTSAKEPVPANPKNPPAK